MSNSLPWYHEDHVLGFSRDYNPTIDLITGVLLSACLLFGTTANILALIYFCRVSAKSLAEKIYTAISSVDLLTSMVHLPVALCLLVGRENPLLFGSQHLCGVWIVLFEFLQRMSIYLVTLLSVSRALAICCPFLRIKEKLVVLSMLPYGGILLIDCIIGIGVYKQVSYYYMDYGYPVRGFALEHAPSLAQQRFTKVIDTVGAVEIIVPSIVNFISFVVSVVQMQMLSDCGTGASQKRKASVTIAIFTFVFLLLNLPLFIMLVCHIVQNYTLKPLPFMETWFFKHHAFLLSKVLCVVLNASANPVLYFCRMTRFNRWLKSLVLCGDRTSSKRNTSNTLTPSAYKLVTHADNYNMTVPATGVSCVG